MQDIATPFTGTADAPGVTRFVMRLFCRNRPGIVAALSTAIFEGGFDIKDAQQFDDPASGRFFARFAFDHPAGRPLDDVRVLMAPVIDRFGMDATIDDAARARKVLILVSRFDHCLADLLYRWRIGELNMAPVGILSNHPRESYLHQDFYGIPFTHLPVTGTTRDVQEAAILRIVEETQAELVVLARYMQILSDAMATALSGMCINIHHSFLPGFKGAKPYHQAFDRGVKLIGATAHYVTPDLDEGPIIEQDVERISHRDPPDVLVRKGRDIERRVLARAVRYHLEDRIIIHDGKTVIFPE